jgi:nicotinate-nucleotide pyrophosphorylase (carboxylating)
MLDNFDGEGLKTAAASLKGRWQGKKQVLLECSGGLTEGNVAEYINNGIRTNWLLALFMLIGFADIDIISTSSVHQGVPHVDFSLKVEH